MLPLRWKVEVDILLVVQVLGAYILVPVSAVGIVLVHFFTARGALSNIIILSHYTSFKYVPLDYDRIPTN